MTTTRTRLRARVVRVEVAPGVREARRDHRRRAVARVVGGRVVDGRGGGDGREERVALVPGRRGAVSFFIRVFSHFICLLSAFR